MDAGALPWKRGAGSLDALACMILPRTFSNT
jgi:hypothetical protein